MSNWWSFCACFLIWCSLAWSFDKLDPVYQISYGDPNAPLQVTEYFSFSCTKCLDFIKKDFPEIKQKYIDTKKIHFIFHPNPADLLTLQAMVCLEKLQNSQKKQFFEVVMTHLEEKNHKLGCFMMQAAMEVLNHPVDTLDKLDFLEEANAFQKAFQFLKQKDVITIVPSVEINGKIYDEYPSRKFLEKTLDLLINQRK